MDAVASRAMSRFGRAMFQLDWRWVAGRGWLVANAVALCVVVAAWLGWQGHAAIVYDAGYYWSAHLDSLYQQRCPLCPSPYSPVFHELLAGPISLPFPAFYTLWTGLLLAVALWLVGPVLLFAYLAFAMPVHLELNTGNIHVLFALMIVLGRRWPQAWAFGLLTKVTPGIGIVWFAARREWRHLAIALGVTTAIATVSFLLAPGLWVAWLRMLVDSTEHPVAISPTVLWTTASVFIRLPIAVALVAIAARLDRYWIVPFAIWLAVPAMWTTSVAIVFLSLPRLVGWIGRSPTSISPIEVGQAHMASSPLRRGTSRAA
ncbi:MAG: DUF2029 domain-containing protein [Chloroflexi bacterium]|nr:DUF2029 domain-containing protein [Chloroflexota bacterium]